MVKYKIWMGIVLILCSSHFSNTAIAYEISAGIGLFEPNDGIVNDTFDLGPVYSFRFGFNDESHLVWLIGLDSYKLESTAGNENSTVTEYLLDFGFQQRFPLKTKQSSIETFFGGGLSIVQLDKSTKVDGFSPIEKQENTFGAYWEVGTTFPIKWTTSSWFELRLKDQLIRKNVFGEINLGGKAIMFGYRWRW